MAATKDSTFYTALRSEIENDPTSLGYAQYRVSGADGAIVTLLNTVRAGTVITISTMKFNDFTHAMISQLQTLSSIQGTQMQILGTAGVVYIGEAATRTYLEGVYSAVGPKAQLQALYTRTGSRAEVLFGENTVVTSDDVAIARTLLAPGTPSW